MPAIGFYHGSEAPTTPNTKIMLGGVNPVFGLDFMAFDSFTSFASSATGIAGAWQGVGKRLVLHMPLTCTGVALTAVTAGTYDSYFTNAASTLIAAGLGNALIRIGLEPNVTGWPWSGTAANYVAAFNHVVGLLKAVSGQQFTFLYCFSNGGTSNGTPDTFFPSSADMIVSDVYFRQYSKNDTTIQQVFANQMIGSPLGASAPGGQTGWGLAWMQYFAGTKQVPFAICEWGTGFGSDTVYDGYWMGEQPYFITAIYNWLVSTGGLGAFGYWDLSSGQLNGSVSASQNVPTGAAPATGIFNKPRQARALAQCWGAPGMTLPYAMLPAVDPGGLSITWGASYAGGVIPNGTASGTVVGTLNVSNPAAVNLVFNDMYDTATGYTGALLQANYLTGAVSLAQTASVAVTYSPFFVVRNDSGPIYSYSPSVTVSGGATCSDKLDFSTACNSQYKAVLL